TRVEHLEQRASWIAAKIGADFVDLIEHHHWIARAGAAQLLNDAARHRGNVSAAMSADLRFVTDAAQTHAYKFSAERISNRLAKACFADTGWPEKTQNWAVSLRIQFAHGQILDESAFYFFEVVMI